MPYISVDDTRLYFDEQGEGPAMVLVHGLGSSGRDWEEQVEHFASRYRVLRLDLRGHGRSERPPGPYHIAQFARDLAIFLRKTEAAPTHVVGLSMGGMVALELAAGAPELVRSLVVVNSVADMQLHSLGDLWFYVSRRLTVQLLGMRRVGRLLAPKLFVKPTQDELRREFRRRWALNDKQAYLRSVDAIMRWTVEDRLHRIVAPVLVISADQDYTPVAAKSRMAAQMRDAELVVVDDTRHALPVEKPEVFDELVENFLGRVEGKTEPVTTAQGTVPATAR